MKKLLVCTDLLEDSVAALAVARQYAQSQNPESVTVMLLFVLDTPISYVAPIGLGPGWVDLEPTIQEGEKRANARLAELAKEYFAEFSPQIMVRRSVQAIYDEILSVAETELADLIVIAKHGRSSMERFLMGSVTTKVVQLAQCPVLVVPVDKKDSKAGS